MKKTTYKYTAKLMREGRFIYVINNDLSVIRLPTMVRADDAIDTTNPARMIHTLIRHNLANGLEIPFDYTVLHDYDNDDLICPFTNRVIEEK